MVFWCFILVWKCFGVVGVVYMNVMCFKYCYVWLFGDWGFFFVEGGIEVVYKFDLEKVEDLDVMIVDILKWMNKVCFFFWFVEVFLVEDIIDLREMRFFFCEFVNLVVLLCMFGFVVFGMWL